MLKINRSSLILIGLIVSTASLAQSADTEQPAPVKVEQPKYTNADGNVFFNTILAAETARVTPSVEAKREATDKFQSLSYGDKVGNKAAGALANLTTGFLEIPKGIINTSNESNLFYGVAGGSIKGLTNMIGRALCGVADLVSLPIPTKPIVSPALVWDNFDVDTTYGDAYRLGNK